MTIEQFHREFKVFFDKTDSSAYPELLDGEIDIYLNEAQERIIKQRYGRNNIYRSGFEEIQKRTEDLKNLVETRFASVSPASSYVAMGDNIFRANLQDLFEDDALTIQAGEEYQFYLKSAVNSCKDDCCKWSRVKLVQHDDISSIAGDPFNKPKFNRPVIFFEGGDIYVWTAEGVTIKNFQVTFLKRAAQMNIGTYGQPRVDCELSEHLQKELLQEAIQIAIENLGSPRVQTQGPVNIQSSE